MNNNTVAFIFGTLKSEAKINTLFNDFNRQVVLAISSQSAHTRTSDSLDEIFDDMKSRINDTFGNNMDITSDIDCVKKCVGNSGYRYHHISLSSYNTDIDYFVSKRDISSDDFPYPAVSVITTNGEESPFVHATICIMEGHDCVTDDTLGKIVKHEITHVILKVIEKVLNIDFWKNVDGDVLFQDENEKDAFEEFLCDYIQWDSTVNPNEDPVEKFREMMKKYLTWVAEDLYTPYLDGINEYYSKLDETDGEGDEDE